MMPFRVQRGQGKHLLAVGCALSIVLPVAVVATPAAGPAEACADDNTKWAMYNSTCADMRWLCNNEGYGPLVRKWCPRTCGLCTPSIGTSGQSSRTTAIDISDEPIVLMAERPTTSVVFSLGRNRMKNTTRKTSPPSPGEDLLRPADRLATTATAAPSNSSVNHTILEANITETGGPSKVLPTSIAPLQWEITLPFKEALVHVLSKAALVPRALWSPDQEYFVFEVGNNSQNSSDNVSSEVVERDVVSNTQALQEEEDSRCPFGYTQVIGHVFGGDQFGRGYNLFAPSMHECARWCTHTPGCGSFEYSPSQKRCFRNSQTRPTDLLDRQGYVFCRRAPCPSLLTEAECLGPNVSPGYFSSEVALRPGSYCIWSAGKCQAPMACTFEDCFLPDGGLPGMTLPPSKTLWISRAGLMSTLQPTKPAF